MQDITGVIMKNNPLSITELTKDPVAYQIYTAMNDRDKLRVQGVINQWHYGKDRIANSDEYKRLRSLASDNTEEFMNTPPSDWKVNNSDWKSLYSIRERILKGGAVNDPRTDRAMKWLQDKYGQTMADMGIDKKKDPEAYHQFRGGLAVALDQFIEVNKKPPNEKQVTEEIWRQLRTETKGPATAFGFELPWSTTIPAFKLPLPEDKELREQLKKEIMGKLPQGSFEPTEGELRTEYMRQLWKQFNQPSKSK
jgi:hypothetical protein